MSNELITVEDLRKWFKTRKGTLSGLLAEDRYVKAVNDVSFTIMKGDTFGLVGETGSGKTTIGEMLLLLQKPTKGDILWDGKSVLTDKQAANDLKLNSHMIFQNITASLNPRKTVEDIVGLPLKTSGNRSWRERRKAVVELLEKVGLTPGTEFLRKHPHELSGGQRQRVDTARAISMNPKFIIADEPVTSLDASISSQIVNLLDAIKREFDLTYLWISHDLTMVRYVSNRVAVLYLGKIMELAQTRDLFNDPRNPYTQALLSAIPNIDPTTSSEFVKLKGEMPSPINLPSGCVFHTRCLYADERCKGEEPDLVDIGGGHFVACHYHSTLHMP